jgi:exosome complex component CSL4
MKIESGDLVMPGDFLAVSEQFLPGQGAYDDDGFIKSTTSGNVSINVKTKEISVISKSGGPLLLKKGDIVYGQIRDLRGQRALVDIQTKKDCDRSFALPYKAAIHISQVNKGYLDRLTEAFRIGDIIEAEVVKVMGDNVDLSTVNDNCGVIKAMCTRCRHYMKPSKNTNELFCENCNRKEKRKL